ncbi:c-type cytochrome [Marinobacterium sediminicola]|uniref:Cytochrome c556 n=1 Tax=Marinobacterium sediminicola TaxID=518898 RepID=A0ABY1S439_9GAMM|nr:cytochrome c [Marinobacterium sediminicola]ULG69863.1 cytochrome c [Marinobacterium sediminicola]SMR77857.1 Cytochrome c556 [Marinobacterium sediminicola]
MKKFAAMGLAGILAAASTMAVAAKPEDAIDYRQGVFSAIKWHFGTMGAMVKGKMEYDAEDFSRRAEIVAQLSKLPIEGFLPGTYEGETSALPAIEDDREKFDGGMKALVERTAALAVAAQTGDLEQIKPAFGEVGKTCKGCHDNFKE